MYAVISPKQFDAMRHLATVARKDECDAEELHMKVRQFCSSVAGVEGYAELMKDLRRASERFIKTDSFHMIAGQRFEYDPARFAAFVEELLDGDKRAGRDDLISNAWACGLNPYGLSANEINARVGALLCIDDDFGAADEMLLEGTGDEPGLDREFLLEGTIGEPTWNTEVFLDASD